MQAKACIFAKFLWYNDKWYNDKNLRGGFMKFGFRKPSIKKSIAARTSYKRFIRHNLGIKAPKGLGLITNPKKAVYNKVYRRTTKSIFDIFKLFK
mgnify:FL=1